MKGEQQQHISTRYTLIPITQFEYQKKLQAYMSLPAHPKTSLCRFYLRGICIMKPQLCKFAHSFQQLVLQEDQQQLIRDCNYTQKQRKKKNFGQKQDFQQKALFILKDVDYFVLHQYQLSQTWKNSQKSNKIYSVAEIKQERLIRVKIRQVLHRQNWTKLINYLVKRYPDVDFSISFLSKWFSKAGFQKPQTRCKFGDFMRYLIFAQDFRQVNIMMPPRLQKTMYFINCREDGPKTYVLENIVQIEKLHRQQRQQYKREVLLKLQPLPEQYIKRFMCRYSMAGNCQYTQQECKYAHSINALRYQFSQKFQTIHKQSVKGREERLNYVSLFRYSQAKIDPNTTLEELNANSNLRMEYRRKMHLQLYSNFMDLLREQTGLDRLQMALIAKQYNGTGFNHSQQNKFVQFESSLWQLGYMVEEIKFQDEPNKMTYVYKIPPIQELDKYFQANVNQILEEEVASLKLAQREVNKKQSQLKLIQKDEDQIIDEIRQLKIVQMEQIQQPGLLILESSFRKKLYRIQEPFNVPLHIYLKLKNKNLQYTIKQLVRDKTLLDHIFFETNQQNYKKLVDICRNYFKNKKDYVHKVENIELLIKNLHKDQINLNGFVNFKNLLQSAILDSGKRTYFLSFGSNNLVIDKGNLCLHQKNFVKAQYQLKNYQDQNEDQKLKLKTNQLSKLRIVIVDNLEAQTYAEMFLINCNKLGVDLQGKLRKQGYIDLIQVSAIFDGQKQIFVFDVFVANKMQDKTLYGRITSLLKNIFEDNNRVKIMHDCKQDSTALKYLMGISLRHVFDTSGMNVILQQKRIYDSWNKKEETTHHLLRKLYQVKTPGLNAVLERWKAPNGVNIFKESMKKMFHSLGTRTYFQKRPIDPQFLQYSAQDVQDLVDIYESIKKQDTQRISQVIGQIYSNYYL